MTLGQEDRQGELCRVRFAVYDLIDGTQDALAGIVEPFRVHDLRPMPVEPGTILWQGAVSLALDGRRLNGDLLLGLHESPFSRGLGNSNLR
ncbi:hypothetical protein StoSoilB22_13020 [Arthrobacter sp. StoSoilB22]|nr:hypothetical protein StoSoilB22_13020 [Arthrobacter sp. StoSoilB22]